MDLTAALIRSQEVLPRECFFIMLRSRICGKLKLSTNDFSLPPEMWELILVQLDINTLGLILSIFPSLLSLVKSSSFLTKFTSNLFTTELQMSDSNYIGTIDSKQYPCGVNIKYSPTFTHVWYLDGNKPIYTEKTYEHNFLIQESYIKSNYSKTLKYRNESHRCIEVRDNLTHITYFMENVSSGCEIRKKIRSGVKRVMKCQIGNTFESFDQTVQDQTDASIYISIYADKIVVTGKENLIFQISDLGWREAIFSFSDDGKDTHIIHRYWSGMNYFQITFNSEGFIHNVSRLLNGTISDILSVDLK